MARTRGGRGRGRNNGGRGNGQRGGGSNNNNNKNAGKAKIVFTPPGTPGVKNPPAFNKVKERILEKVMKVCQYGHDIRDSLKAQKKINLDPYLPVLKSSNKIDPDEAKLENASFEKMHNAQIVEYTQRLAFLENNELEAASLIISDFCHEKMVTRLSYLPNYDTELSRDPYKLLNEIASQMRQSDDKEHFLWTSADTISSLTGIKQEDGESLQDYRERFVTARHQARNYIGNDYLEKMAMYDNNVKDEYSKLVDDQDKKDFVEKLVKWQEAMFFFKGADKKRYGAYFKHLKRQHTGKQDQYPKTLDEAVTALQGNENASSTGKSRNQGSRNNPGNNRSQASGPSSNDAESSFNSAERYCWVCGDLNHKANECSERNTRPRRDWEQSRRRRAAEAANSQQSVNVTANSGENNNNNADDSSVTSEVTTTSRQSRRGSTFHSHHYEIVKRATDEFCAKSSELSHEEEREKHNFFRGDIHNALMMDSGTTSTMVCNRDLVTNVSKAKDPIYMKSNFGGHEINLKGSLKAIPHHRVWIHDKGSANVVSLSELEKVCDCVVTYECGTFTVTTPDGKTLDFKRNCQGLFLYWPELEDRSELTTVRSNIEGYTKRQVDRAKAARDLYHKVGAPTITNLKALLRQNILSNCPVTPEDVDLAEKIFGPDAATLKGRTTRRNPAPTKADYIDIPEELLQDNRDVDLYIDVMFVNKNIPLLTTIDGTIKFRHVVPLENRTSDVFYAAIDKVLRLYNKGGFRITHIHCDGEFRSLMDAVVDDMDITMNYANPGDHVPENVIIAFSKNECESRIIGFHIPIYRELW